MTLAAAGEPRLSTPEHRQFRASLQASLAPSSAPEAGGRPYGVMLWLLGAKYPRRVGDVYRTLLSTPEKYESQDVVHHLLRGPLPLEEQLALLGLEVSSPHVAHQYAALRELPAVAPKPFSGWLADCLRRLPRSTAGTLAACHEALLCGLTGHTDADDVWRALEQAARRADVGLRLEILAEVSRESLPDRSRPRIEKLLAAFLSDDTVRALSTEPETYQYSTASWMPRLPVRDWVTLELARRMEIENPAGSPLNWTESEWETVHRAVVEKRAQ